MVFQASSPGLTVLLALFSLLSLLLPAHALYFYVDGRQTKCFYEDLPKDTLVAGTYSTYVINPNTNTYNIDHALKVQITVDETFDNDHRVVNKRDSHSGRFTFTAAEAGEHRICFMADTDVSTAGWLSNGQGGVKVSLDLAIGETSKIETEDKDKMKDIVQRVRDLNSRLHDIRREQVYQREREAEFRDQSETTNSRVVRWTLIQLAVLSAACAWQLSHLRSFFIKQKLT
ncbi:membrane protein [Penicillium chermesinum]|uniref:Membrane protein n=1 Tax=Penicillium chermesinum TaxID=63820 RepID=A0A9W9TPJ1_9EURO|nr:uncharacterized protein N7468_005285 [Penicillium chermesinum]KAJ5232329.1 membrane protein [Penicillium chermesinum]KAJ6171984.1 membrane protein [Penicillium chermesinum]